MTSMAGSPPPARPASRSGAAGTLAWAGRILAAVLVAVLLGSIAFLAVPPFRHAVQAAALLPEILELGVRPLSMLTDEPLRVRTTYGEPNPERMDIYLPAHRRPGTTTPAVMLVLGVHPDPIEHPVVVATARAIARLGIAVGIPESTELRSHRITPDEPGRMAEAFIALTERQDLETGSSGMIGFSAGASLALVAAADPRIAERVAYVNAFGGYADARMLIADIMTRTMIVDGRVVPWTPDQAARTGLLDTLLWPLPSHEERVRLRAEALPILLAEPRPSGAYDPAFAGTLGDEGRALYQLVTARSRAEAEALIGRIPAATDAHLDAISPSTFAAGVRAGVFLMHDVDDPAIPVSHVHVLDDLLRDGVVRRTTVFELFHHVQPGDDLGLAEIPQLWRLFVHLHHLLGTAVS
jgi:dienelactone hydrolase